MKIQQWLFELLRKQNVTDGRTDGQRENSIPPTNKGYNNLAGFQDSKPVTYH